MGYIKVFISNNKKVKVCKMLTMQIETIIVDTLYMMVINETSRQRIHTVLIGENQYSV